MSKNTHEADVAFVKALAELLRDNDLTELEVKRDYGEDDSLNVRVSRASMVAPVAAAPVQYAAPAAPVAAAPAAAAPAAAPATPPAQAQPQENPWGEPEHVVVAAAARAAELTQAFAGAAPPAPGPDGDGPGGAP